MPIIRQTPLKQNIRVWFDYLKVALTEKTLTIKKNKEINLTPLINKEYYRAWDLPQVRKLSFDKWWKTHKHLFAHKEFINVRVLNELSLNDAMKEVRKQLIDKVNQKTSFHITSKKFRYREVDDYLKCWKLRQKEVYSKKYKEMRNMEYLQIAYKLKYDYIKKAPLYETTKVDGKRKKSKLIKRNFKAQTKIEKQKRNVLHSVKKRVNNAKTIIMNTARGTFTGKY